MIHSFLLVNTAFFQIQLRPVSNCAEWIVSHNYFMTESVKCFMYFQEIDQRQKLEDVKSEIKQAITPRCGCEFDIDNEMFSCPQSQEESEDTVLFKARIVVRVPVSVTDADDVVNYINDWVKLGLNITVTLVILTVDSCPTGVDPDACVVVVDQSTDNDSSSSSGAIIGAVLAGVFVAITILVLVVIIVLVCIQRRRLRYSCRM